MIISSRTPEGLPNRCPVCQNLVRIEPSRPPGDAPCPCCGHLLWFAPSGPPRRPSRTRWSRRARGLVRSYCRSVVSSNCRPETVRELTTRFQEQLEIEIGHTLNEEEKQAVLVELRREFELAGGAAPNLDEPWWKLW